MLLYCLHFDAPVSGKLHYAGSCEDEQLRVRLRRHQCGTGSNLTSRAHKQGVGFTVGMIKQIPDRSFEAKWKKAKRWKLDCMCCLPVANVPSMFPEVHYFPPIAQNNLEGLCLPRGNATGSPPGHEKRRAP